MGKRGLLMVAALAAVGLLVWHAVGRPPAPEPDPVVAPPADASEDTGEPVGPVTVTSSDTLALPVEIDEIRIGGVPAVEVRGEARRDLSWTLSAEATASDEAAARASAATAVLRRNDQGRVLSLGVAADEAVVPTSRLTLLVPAATRLRLENSAEATVEGVDTVRLENLPGRTTLRHVEGGVDGSHRSGDLLVEQAGRVTLTLNGTAAILRDVQGELRLDARGGSTTIERPAGVTAVEAVDQRLVISHASGPIRGSARGGEVEIEAPGALVDFDVRGADLTLRLAAPVPVMLFGRDAHMEITLPREGDIRLDVVSEGGTIDATALGLEPATMAGEQSLSTESAGPRLTIRTQRGAVVIRPGK
jgi:hypothetical protein